MKNRIVKHYRTSNYDAIPNSNDLDFGELAIKYVKGNETIFIKNNESEIIEFKDKKYIDNLYNRLITNTELKFYCIEPVTVIINGEQKYYQANSYVDLFFNSEDEFIIETTSDSSISTLNAYPGALSEFLPWLEGVNTFTDILFDMNNLSMYEKWNQGNQGLYHVQFAQYKNCIFWSDNPYISDVAKRPNYTLYYSVELPLCYSTIPENTFKSFYFAYSVHHDPNWSNPIYKESFALATHATQVFSYYGAKTIGIFDMDSSRFNINLPKDCRGLMFCSPNIESAGVFDAINVTNFGAKSGSWRDAFAYCYSLKNLYIKNLKVNLNISWSPVNLQSIEFIVNKAINTNAITISLSPFTYYRLTDEIKTIASNKNITLELLASNYLDEDIRLNKLIINGNGSKFLSDDGNYKTLTIPNNLSEFNNDVGFITSETLATNNEKYYTKEEVDNLLSNYVSIDVVEQMIEDSIDIIDGGDY